MWYLNWYREGGDVTTIINQIIGGTLPKVEVNTVNQIQVPVLQNANNAAVSVQNEVKGVAIVPTVKSTQVTVFSPENNNVTVE